jgi:SAM-dependent methyltransferase
MNQTLGYYSSARTEIGLLLPEKVDTILEIGCGTGATMAWIRSVRHVEYAVGIELFAAAASEARGTFDEIMVGDLGTLELRFSTSFDVILALDVLEHLADPWSVVEKLRRALTPDGVMLVSIPNVAHFRAVFPLLMRGAWNYDDSGILDRTHLRFFTKETALGLFTSGGFLIEQIEYVRSYPNLFYLFSDNERWRWYSRKIMSRVFPDRLSNFQFLIRARQNLEKAAA